ncbi:MAG: hypothetical protein FJ290_06325 [Planctomycetes bacterium]|nr:hypothetical protein [Planctomycetota bacterium]
MHGIVWQALLFAGGLGWCALVGWRLPAYLAELSRTFKRYRASRNPHTLGAIKETHGRREHHRKQCAKEFWGTLALQLFFLWPLTLLALAAIGWFVYSLISMVAGGL